MKEDIPLDEKLLDEQVTQPKVDTDSEIPFTAPSSSHKQWQSGRGCSRLPAIGCGIGIVLLVAALVVGVSLARRSVWMAWERSRQQVVQGLPFRLDPGERVRTTQNLQRFRAVLEASSDPYPLMGDFRRRVRNIFDDGRLTADEVEELNQFLEKFIEESGIPLLQLDSQISNFRIHTMNLIDA